jgi:hypothetical protein
MLDWYIGWIQVSTMVCWCLTSWIHIVGITTFETMAMYYETIALPWFIPNLLGSDLALIVIDIYTLASQGCFPYVHRMCIMYTSNASFGFLDFLEHGKKWMHTT